MAARRAVRSTRRDDEDERVEPEDELAGEPEDEEPEDELAGEPEDEEPEEAGHRHTGRRSGRTGGITAAKAGQQAMRQIAELTGKQTEGITGVEPGDDGWIVGVEVVEDQRIPSSTDILATYETEVDADGELVSYRRVKRYTRGHGDSESL